MNKKSFKIKQFFITIAQRMADFSTSREILGVGDRDMTLNKNPQAILVGAKILIQVRSSETAKR